MRTAALADGWQLDNPERFTRARLKRAPAE